MKESRQISVRVDVDLVARAEELVECIEVSSPGGATLTAVWRAALVRGVREIENDNKTRRAKR